jgi:phosphoribosylaminoimidazole-succinocarboxamide synthase
MVVSDRISGAFDGIARTYSYKGQVLNQIAAISLEATTKLLCQTGWVINIPILA